MNAVLKAMKLLPLMIDLISDVDAKVKAAKDPASSGGAKVTALEIGKIVSGEIGPLVSAIVALFVDAPAVH